MDSLSRRQVYREPLVCFAVEVKRILHGRGSFLFWFFFLRMQYFKKILRKYRGNTTCHIVGRQYRHRDKNPIYCAALHTLTNIVSYQYCMHYRYRLVFLICMCPPLIYIAMDCIMRYLFSLRVFKQMDAHTRPHSLIILHIHTRAPAFINYF